MLQEGEAAGGFWNRRVSIRRLAGYLSMFSEHREDVATAKSCATCRRVADYTIGGSSSKGQLNIKVRSETLDAFYSIADAEKWVLGETIERAVAALQKELSAK
jgi:hypothetical protein